MTLVAGFYDRYILPRLIDFACSNASIAEQRQVVVPQATGTVLEIGIGSGLNLPYYDTDKVKNIIGIDPGAGVLNLGKSRFDKAGIPLDILQESAEKIPLESNSIDTVLLTWAGCSIPDLPAALAEMRRVLKPGGKMVFCEHGLSSDPHIARRQQWLNKLWPIFAGGCNINRDMQSLIGAAGFKFRTIETYYAPKAPKTLAFHYRGVAEKR